MELNYDWLSFQSMFYPKRRSAVQAGGEVGGPVYLVVEGSQVVSVFAESEDLSDWIGADLQDVATEMPHRELLVLDRANVDEWMNDLSTLPHAHDQIGYIRKKAASAVTSTRGRRAHAHLGHHHFLLEAIQGSWSKFLPSNYGLFIRLEGQQEQDLFVIVRRGRVEAFHEPDLVSMGKDRRKVPAEVVKYLSEKHLVPVQGVMVPAQQWAEWSSDPHPWRKVALSLKANQAKLFPFNWGLVSLMASRAFLGL